MTTTVRVPARIAVLSALQDGGSTTIAEVAEATKMSKSAVTQTLGRLRKKDPPLAKRINKHGGGTIALFKITRDGRTALRRAKKKLGL